MPAVVYCNGPNTYRSVPFSIRAIFDNCLIMYMLKKRVHLLNLDEITKEFDRSLTYIKDAIFCYILTCTSQKRLI